MAALMVLESVGVFFPIFQYLFGNNYKFYIPDFIIKKFFEQFCKLTLQNRQFKKKKRKKKTQQKDFS